MSPSRDVGVTMSVDSEPDGRSAGDVNRTQEAILAAYAELIEELGTDDVSFRLDRPTCGRRRAHGVPQLCDTGRSAARDGGMDRARGCSRARSPRASSTCPSRSGRRWSRTTIGRNSRTSWPKRRCAAISGAAPSPRRAHARGDDRCRGPCARRDASAGRSSRRWPTSTRPRPGSRFAASSAWTRSDIADAAAWAAEAVLDPIRSRVG